MNSIKNIHNVITPALLLTTSLLTMTSWGFPITTSAQNTPSKQETSSAQQIQLMFVQTSEDFKANPKEKTLRLINVNPQTLYFSDRPQRVAGNLTMPAYFDEWTAKAGPDNFKNDPPNATLSVSGGATALFIDWIGAGGGVEPGFHGVGAGTRGVGVTGGYGGPAR
ncbi:MAG: hypothetical protein GC158_00950 [Cyanobacteria bacterium RI_101]|nr:hypothetical protein [Cyanobacteria bacterium RI_101]